MASASNSKVPETPDTDSKDDALANGAKPTEESKEEPQSTSNSKPVLDKRGSKSGSSYYLYKSTDKEEAKKYAPKKLVEDEAKRVESTVKAQSKGSSWNTGATMEQFDYSEWMKQQMEQLLLSVVFQGSSLRITEVVKVEGSATILLIRGQYRPGYDISFEAKWSGMLEPGHLEDVVAPIKSSKKKKKSDGDSDGDDAADKERQKRECRGTLKMHDITSEDDPDDWEYEVTAKKKSKRNKAAMRKVRDGRDSVVEIINVLVKELKKKKS